MVFKFFILASLLALTSAELGHSYKSAPSLQYGVPASQYGPPAVHLSGHAITHHAAQPALIAHQAPLALSHGSALHVAQPAVHYAQPALHVAQPAVHYAQPALHVAQPAVHYAQPALHVAQPAVHYAQPAVHVAQPALHVAHQPAEVHLAAPVGHAVAYQPQDHYAPAHYSFKYGVHDPHTGDDKEQEETNENGLVKGYYAVTEPDGRRRVVHYTADDHNGFNAQVEYQGHAVAHVAPVVHAQPAAVVHAAPAVVHHQPALVHSQPAIVHSAPTALVHSAPVVHHAAAPAVYGAPLVHSISPASHHGGYY